MRKLVGVVEVFQQRSELLCSFSNFMLRLIKIKGNGAKSLLLKGNETSSRPSVCLLAAKFVLLFWIMIIFGIVVIS